MNGKLQQALLAAVSAIVAQEVTHKPYGKGNRQMATTRTLRLDVPNVATPGKAGHVGTLQLTFCANWFDVLPAEQYKATRATRAVDAVEGLDEESAKAAFEKLQARFGGAAKPAAAK